MLPISEILHPLLNSDFALRLYTVTVVTLSHNEFHPLRLSRSNTVELSLTVSANIRRGFAQMSSATRVVRYPNGTELLPTFTP